ncbi:NAD-dependent epimerase/dehydratase family protein [Devosia sp.]|uniref:NAD-dependent epimerase/dehydratase family protein n=1 Tax=Devosia sp. TaxID=1871048 RepID=UPI003A9256A5
MAEDARILVTGATGFVGKWVVIQLLQAGYQVRGTIRSLRRADEVRDGVATQTGPDLLANLELVEADLLDDRGWSEAMEGITAVMHVAAAVRGDEPKDQSLVIRPAVEGTERVLRSAHAAGITRVIMTSSVATVGYGHGTTPGGKRVFDETYMTKFETLKYTWAYCVGKTTAERNAWAFAKANGMELTTIHPGAIVGPAVDGDPSISIGLATGLLEGRTPAMPNNGFAVVDVRDVAALHAAALEKPESIGERYLATAEYLPFHKVADILRAEYPGWPITEKRAPDWIIRLVARFGGPARQIIDDIGNEKHYDTTKSVALLGRAYISGRDAVLASAESAVRLGLVKKPEPKR